MNPETLTFKQLEKLIHENQFVIGQHWTTVEENHKTLALELNIYCSSNWVKTRVNHGLVAQTKEIWKQIRKEIALQDDIM